MRNILLILLPLFCLCAVVSAADETQFNIKVSVMDDGAANSVRGSGSFIVEENDYGRISIVYFDNRQNFKIHVIGSDQLPSMHLLDQDGTYFTGDMDAVIDLYIKPIITADKQIRLSGYAAKMINNDPAGQGCYKYDEEAIDFIMQNGGEQIIRLKLLDPVSTISLKIAAYSIGGMDYVKKTERKLVFNTEYKLINHDADVVELENNGCTLTFAAGSGDEKGNCTYEKMFLLPGGDSLLYSVECSIDNPRWNDDGSVSFDFEFSRIYATNPIKAGITSGQLKADKGALTSFSKRLTVLPGERTEIEVPPGKENPLPFAATDLIALTNPEQFVPLDVVPELISAATPMYPINAKKSKIEGAVKISAYIGPDGTVRNVRVLECTRPGHGFEETALEAAYKNKYKPGAQGNKPVAVWVTYTVKFAID